jgi:hypothetical protein
MFLSSHVTGNELIPNTVGLAPLQLFISAGGKRRSLCLQRLADGSALPSKGWNEV